MSRQPLFFIVVGLVVGTFIFVMAAELNKKEKFDDDLVARATGYIDALTQFPVESLGREQKLLLLHSYYVVQKYDDVLAIAEVSEKELKDLSQERFKAFDVMIRDARRKSGR